MSAIIDLIRIYNRYGYSVLTGLNPSHFYNCVDVPFTSIRTKNEPLSVSCGVALQEVYFFETLFEKYHPKNIFIVGNAFGWSTILMAILNPLSRVVSLDAGTTGTDNDRGINLTNRIAQKEKLNIKVLKGFSPKDTKSVVKKEFSKKVDFVFIDGLHTNEQQGLDYREIHKYADKNCVYVFHDVINCKLEKSFEQISDGSDNISRILFRTPSGMGILYPKKLESKISDCVSAFSEDPHLIKELKNRKSYKSIPVRAIKKCGRIVKSFILHAN